jgi:hypothetical protein
MAFYADSEQFNATLQALFDRVQATNPEAAADVEKSNLLLRFMCTNPQAEILINGRRKPPTITLGQDRIRPEVDVHMEADTLHAILLGELGLAKALAGQNLRVRGPARKTLALTDLFHQCQLLYPTILREQGLAE